MKRGEIFLAHSFELACAQNDIDHRLTKPCHPWTNGQVERMNRTLKDATVRRYYDDTHDQLRGHLSDVLAAYNFARRLKTLRGLTPYKYICKTFTSEPQHFRLDLLHQMPGLLFSIRRVEVKRLPSCPTPQCSMFFARPCFSSGSALTPSQYGIRRMKRAI
jgi:hypothetical protein